LFHFSSSHKVSRRNERRIILLRNRKEAGKKEKYERNKMNRGIKKL